MLAMLSSIKKWFVSSNVQTIYPEDKANEIDWLRVIPFFLVHLGCFGVIWVGVSWSAVCVALGLYWLRAMSISAFYHRYLSHRAYKTSRVMQFIFAVLGASAMQKGPLWWASWHRNHHRFSDQAEDAHSPLVHGFWYAHMGWFLTKKNYCYDEKKITDLMQFPELVLLNRHNVYVPLVLALTLYYFGGAQMLIWGFFISTIAVFHTTASVNSMAHQFGSRPYNTKDNSRNSLIMGLLTFGEGWHNNHHFYPASARIGFKWYQIDVTYYMLVVLQKLGLIWDLRGCGKLENEFKALATAEAEEVAA